jgi:hypothetical protein
MCNPDTMQIRNRTDHMMEITFRSVFVQTFMRLDNFVQVTALAQLHYQEYIATIHNHVLQFSDAGMSDLTVDAKLVDEMPIIILRMHQIQSDDFARVDFIGALTITFPNAA